LPLRRAAHRRCHADCRPAAHCRHRAARCRCLATLSCRPPPFVFLGSQLEELDQTKAQWRRP
jgi:hypothetical protein